MSTNESTLENMVSAESPYVINENTLIYLSTDGIGYSVHLSELLEFMAGSSFNITDGDGNTQSVVGFGGTDIKRLNILRPKFEINEYTNIQLIISENCDFTSPTYSLNSTNYDDRNLIKVFDGSNFIPFPNTGLDNTFENKNIVFYLNLLDTKKIYYAKYKWYGDSRINQDWYGFSLPGYTLDITEDLVPYDKLIEIIGASELWEGSTSEYTCRVTMSDGTIKIVTPTWSSTGLSIDNSGTASVPILTQDSTGVISATYNGITARKSVSLKHDRIIGILITGPTKVQMGVSQPVSFVATANYLRGSSKDVTNNCTWTSSNTNMSLDGKVTWTKQRSSINTSIVASLDGISSTHELLIEFVGLVSIEIVGPSRVCMDTGSQSYYVLGTYTNGSTSNIDCELSLLGDATLSNGLVSWDSTGEDDLTVGLTATWTDEDDSTVVLTNSKSITIWWNGIISLVIQGLTTIPIAVGTSSYEIQGTKVDGTKKLITPSSTMTSSNTNISGHTISWNTGGTSDITTQLSATYKAKPTSTRVVTGNLSILIDYVKITRIEISGGTSINPNSSVQLSCKAYLDDGSSKSISPTWSISGQCSINQSGLVSVGDVLTTSTDIARASLTCSDGTFTDDHNISVIKKYSAQITANVVGIGTFTSSRINNLSSGTKQLTFVFNSTFANNSPKKIMITYSGCSNKSNVISCVFETSAGVQMTYTYNWANSQSAFYNAMMLGYATKLVSITMSVEVV